MQLHRLLLSQFHLKHELFGINQATEHQKNGPTVCLNGQNIFRLFSTLLRTIREISRGEEVLLMT